MKKQRKINQAQAGERASRDVTPDGERPFPESFSRIKEFVINSSYEERLLAIEVLKFYNLLNNR
jgi:hypothetical protein